MIAIQADTSGGPEVLTTVEVSRPEPGTGQVLVRNEAIGVNLFDTYQRSGLYPLVYPARFGNEGTGVVEAVGDGVTLFAPGDRVAYAGGSGAYAQFHLAPEARTIALPDGIAADTAAASLMKGMLAYALLHDCARIGPGQSLVVLAAAGGVGSIVSQWGRALGARVICVVGSQAKADVALASGAEAVITGYGADLPARVKALNDGAGVDVVYDGVGAATLESSLSCLRPRGLLVGFGNASGPTPAVDPMRLMRGGSLIYTRIMLGDFIATREAFETAAEALFDRIGSGDVRITVGQRWPLAQAAEAHRALEARQTVGSTLLIP